MCSSDLLSGSGGGGSGGVSLLQTPGPARGFCGHVGYDTGAGLNVPGGTWFSASTRGNVNGAGGTGMSWSELERVVSDAESNAELRHTLRRCRSRQQLLQAAPRLGYRIPALTCRTPGLSTSRARRLWIETLPFPRLLQRPEQIGRAHV